MSYLRYLCLYVYGDVVYSMLPVSLASSY